MSGLRTRLFEDDDAMDMDKLVSLCKRRGFIFPSSEIYGGINGFWDYGPFGVELKRNIKDAWWRDHVSGHDDRPRAEGEDLRDGAEAIELSVRDRTEWSTTAFARERCVRGGRGGGKAGSIG